MGVFSRVRFTVRFKLVLAFAIMIVLLVTTGAVSYLQVRTLSHNIDELNGDWMPGVSQVAVLNGSLTDTERLVMRVMYEPDPKENKRLADKLAGQIANVNKQIETYAQTTASAEDESALLQEVKGGYDKFTAAIPAITKASQAGDLKASSELLLKAHSDFLASQNALVKLVDYNKEGGNRVAADSVNAVSDSRRYILILSSAAAVLALVLALWISRSLADPLKRLSAVVRRAAEGDLQQEVAGTKRGDEIGDLIRDFRMMFANLREIIGSVANNAHQVAATSQELSASAEQTGKSAEEVATSIQTIAEHAYEQKAVTSAARQSTDSLVTGMNQIASSIDRVETSTRSVREQVRSGEQTIRQVKNQMDEIQSRVSATVESVGHLGLKSEEIGAIAELITSIARQTNLLALNAGIEAARAGEHGRGFAVVAGEIRKLAEQTNASTEQIRSLVEDIRQSVGMAGTASREGAAAVTNGVELTRQAGDAFDAILESVELVSTDATQVTAITQQARDETQTMAASVSGMAEQSEQTSAHAEQIAAAAEEQNASMEEIAAASTLLARLAEELMLSVQKFKV